MKKNAQARPETSMEVVDDAGYFIGTVENVEHDHFVVQQGFFFPKDHRIPNSAIGEISDAGIRLRISRETAMHESSDMNWAEYPESSEIVSDIGDEEKPAAKSDIDPHKI